MTGHSSKTAREIATAVLNQFDPERSPRNYAGTILNKLLQQTSEKQRATDLVFGTIRNRTAIDKVIATFSGRPLERIQTKLLNIIRIASFELLYSPQTPEYSIVNEAVNAAKSLRGKKQTAFVNAVLRQITRHIKNRQIPLSQTNPKKTLPQTLSTGCQFDADILPDPEASLADYFSIAFSLPKWLVTEWLNELSPEQVRQICFASNRRPSIYIRPNTLKTTTQNLAEIFRQANIDFKIVPNVIPAQAGIQSIVIPAQAGIQKSNDADDSMIKLKAAKAVTELPGFAEGLFTVQDLTASQPVRLLKPQPGWTILDLCAAPGTKTTQLAELTEDSAKIIATDIDTERLKSVKENTARLGINSVRIVAYENLQKVSTRIGPFDCVLLDVPCSNTARLGINSVRIVAYENLQKVSTRIGPFDCVLLDVPCSNTGVLAKRIEARYRINPKAIEQLTKTQSDLLATAAKMLKPKGKIAYSTCSIQKAENNQLVKDFLRQNPSFELESELLTLPSAEEFAHDGGYVAIITGK